MQLAVILTLGIFLINAGYDFEGAGTRLREFAFVSSPLTGKYAEGWSPGNRFAGSWLGTLRVPLPRNYLEGIDLQWHDIELGKPSYLRGRWQERGWWYWYLYALAVKVPLGTWGLFLLTVGVRVAARFKKNPHAGLLPVGHPHPGPLPEGEGGRNPGVPGESVPDRITWRDELVLLAPAVAVLVLVSSQTGFSRYIRYILPAFPFVFVWISSVAAWAWPERNSRQPTKIPHPSPLPEGEGVSPHPRPFPEGEGARNGTESVFYGAMRTVRDWFARNGRGVIVCSLLAWSIGSSLWYAPHWMSYFNELAGGPVGGPKHLIDAQVDWGQDLLYLKKWLDAHPEARPLGFVYFGPINPTLAGVDFFVPPKGIVVGHDRIELARLPDSLMPGWYAVSVNYLYGYDHYIHDPSGSREWVTRPYYSYFRRFEPVAMAGYSIYIYHLTVAEIEEARDRWSEAREE